MNILVISQFYYPENFRVNDICEGLVQFGHKVTVLTSLPNYPQGIIYDGYKRKYKEIHNGVHILRCKCRPRYKGLINLALNYISFVCNALKCIKKIDKNFDLIYVYQMSPIFMAIPAIKAKKILNKPLYLYCLDVWPESIKEYVKNEKNIIYKIVKKISMNIYKKCDFIAVKCPSFVAYLNNICEIDIQKIIVLPEHAEDTYLKVQMSHKNKKIIDFYFMGNIGKSQNCSIIIKAVNIIHEKYNFKVHFVGDGSDLENIKKMVSNMKLEDKIFFHGRVNINKIIEYYNRADVCILTLSNDTFIGKTVPAKLTGYLAAGKAVIAAIDGDSQKIIADSKCGYYVPANDYIAFSKLMEKCIQDPKNLEILGKNGRDYFLSNFTKDIYITRLISSFNYILEIDQ